MIVVDTSVWVDYFNQRKTPQAGVLDKLIRDERLVLGDLILAELLQGLRSEREFELVLGAIRTLAFREMVGRDVALIGARNYRLLRSKGVTVRGTIDVLIATFCLLNGHDLLHSD